MVWQEVEKGKAFVPPMPEHFGAAMFTADDAREWQEWHEYSQDYSRYDYEIDEDEEVSGISCCCKVTRSFGPCALLGAQLKVRCSGGACHHKHT